MPDTGNAKDCLELPTTTFFIFTLKKRDLTNLFDQLHSTVLFSISFCLYRACSTRMISSNLSCNLCLWYYDQLVHFQKKRMQTYCWFFVTPFKIDQNKNQNRSIDKVQNLGNERRYIYKAPRQDSGQRNISHTKYPKKCFTQTYRDLYREAMLVVTWMSSNMADGNQQTHLLLSFATKA